MARINDNCPHKDAAHHAKGMCKPCYRAAKDAAEKHAYENTIVGKETPQAVIKPTVPGPPPNQATPAQALQLPLNTFNSAVVDYCVRELIENQMDEEKAVDAMTKLKPVSATVRAQMIEQMRSDLRIRTAVQADLRRLGLDDESKRKFLDEMTRWLYNEADPRLRATAARVFAKAFIAERIEEKKIEELPIRDLASGLKELMSEAIDPHAAKVQ